MVEARSLGLRDRGVATQQVDGEELQVVEVDCGALRLALVEAGGEGGDELPKRLVAAAYRGDLGRRGRLVAAVDSADRDRGQLRVEDAAVAKLGVGGEHDRTEPAAVARRREGDCVVVAGQLGQDLVEAGPGESSGLVGIEDPEAGIEAGGDGVGGEEAPAEAVDGRDRRRFAGPGRGLQPGPLGLLRGRGGTTGQLDADPAAHLRCRFLGEREGEDPLRLDAVDGDRLAVALHEDARLAGSGPGLEEDVAVAISDRLRLLERRAGASAASVRPDADLHALRRRGGLCRRIEAELLVAAHAAASSSSSSSGRGIERSIRQTGASVHQAGQAPSWGSRSIRPARIESTTATASRRAVSSTSSKLSASKKSVPTWASLPAGISAPFCSLSRSPRGRSSFVAASGL